MVDDTPPGDAPSVSICPWCSAPYEGTPTDCPSCGATLTGDAALDPSLPGLTAIDAAAIVRSREPSRRGRNRLLSWISGDYPEEPGAKVDAGALAPPDADVRREILRLELEAEVANLQAEADALRAEATAEGRSPDASPQDSTAADVVVAELDAVSADLVELDAVLDELDASLQPDKPSVSVDDRETDASPSSLESPERSGAD
jgi:hypothetical protein